MKSRGVPVSCVGHQMHVNIATPLPGDVAPMIQPFADLGLDNQITEMDVSVYTDDTSRYEEIAPELSTSRRPLPGLLSRVPAPEELDQLGDPLGHRRRPHLAFDLSIVRLDRPLLFDDYLQAKPSYWGVVDSAPGGMEAFIPSSARAAGFGGAFFTTDLTVANTSATDTTVQLKFLGHDGDGRGGTERSFPLPAGRSTTFSTSSGRSSRTPPISGPSA